MTKSLLVSTFILFCSVIIESSILSNITFLMVVPDLVLICCVYFSLLNGKIAGETTGFISGLFLDFVTGIPFGFNCLFRTIMGYIFGCFTETVLLKGLVIPMVTIGIATLLKSLLVSAVTVFFPNVDIFHPGIISQEVLFEFVLNLVLAPIAFKFLSFFNNLLEISTTQDKVDNV